MKTLIIAEAGVNHNGDLELAHQLIEVAASSGADFVKFQTFNADKLATKSAKKAKYQLGTTGSSESHHEMLRALELSMEMHVDLIAYCNKFEIKFLSTAFDIDSIDFLLSLGQEIFKVPSGEITNLPYLRHLGSLNKNIILSSGMSTLGEVEQAINLLVDAGTSKNKIKVLHCTTEYPAPMREVNLRAMKTMGDLLGVETGYSDHTMGIEVSIAAVAMGASIIEKHFTLNRGLPGPDHKASLEPLELRDMVVAIRNIELALGDGIKRPTISELENINAVRKSIVAKKNIKKGELFGCENITVKRPGLGISPMCWDKVIGKVALRDFAEDELIEI